MILRHGNLFVHTKRYCWVDGRIVFMPQYGPRRWRKRLWR